MERKKIVPKFSDEDVKHLLHPETMLKECLFYD
jgi:hypothetical protein